MIVEYKQGENKVFTLHFWKQSINQASIKREEELDARPGSIQAHFRKRENIEILSLICSFFTFHRPDELLTYSTKLERKM